MVREETVVPVGVPDAAQPLKEVLVVLPAVRGLSPPLFCLHVIALEPEDLFVSGEHGRAFGREL